MSAAAATPLPAMNLEAEEYVLGALMLRAESGIEAAAAALRDVCASGIEASDFYRLSHGQIFTAISALVARSIAPDALSVVDVLEREHLLDDGLTAERIREIASTVPAAHNAPHHAAIVVAASRRRTEDALGRALQAAAANGGLDADSQLRERLSELLRPSSEVGAFVLEPMTARDLCERPDPDKSDELLGGLVVKRYRTLVGGHTGEGKTTLALGMLRAIVEGDELLGYAGCGDVRGLVLDAEQGEKSLKRRLREAGLDRCDQVDVIRVPDGLSLDADPRHVAELERILVAGGYSVVLADPLYKLHVGDSNAEREAVDLMRRFDAWRDELGFALLLPLHCRKPIPGLKFSIHDLFGSSAYVRGAEVVLGLQRVRDGYSRLHYLKDRDGDLPIGNSWGLLFDRDHGYRRDPEDGKREPTTAEHVRDLLRQTPWMTKAQLVEATGRKARTVEAALRDLDATSERRGGSTGPHFYALSDLLDSQPARSQLALDEEAPK